jgi:hypothetical protein
MDLSGAILAVMHGMTIGTSSDDFRLRKNRQTKAETQQDKKTQENVFVFIVYSHVFPPRKL